MAVPRAGLVLPALLLAAAAAATAQAPPDPTRRPEPEPPSEPILGAPSGFGALPAEERLWVEAGTRLLERPDPSAAAVAFVDAAQELPVLERRGGWVRLRYGVFRGWLLPGVDDGGGVPADEVRRLEEATRAAVDLDRLERARGILGPGGRETHLGPYRLYTDLDDDALLHRLARLAASVGEAYRGRFGLDPGPPDGEAVVLFARDADYRRLSAAEAPLAGLEAHGHAGGGLAALSAGGEEPEGLAALLVHELVHLLNRRTFPAELPPWLEEGLAEALAYGRVDDAGRLEADALGGRSNVRRQLSWSAPDLLVRARNLELSGPRAALGRLVEGWERDPRRLPLEDLVALPWQELVDPARREILYPESAFFVRFLLDGGEPALAAGFRAYLAAVAAGEPAGEEALGEHLGRGWQELEDAYYDWLRRQAARHLSDPSSG